MCFGVGIPIFVETELSAKNVFAAKNGQIASDQSNSGVKLDIDMFKISFDMKCIIGVEMEVNVDVIKVNALFMVRNRLHIIFALVF